MIINKVNMTVSTFKARYDTDEAFREAHLAYIKAQVKCKGCGRFVTRCNMVRHRRSNWHKKHSLDTPDISDISDLEEHKREIKNIYKKKINEINKQIRAIEKEKQRKLDKIDKKIQKRLNS